MTDHESEKPREDAAPGESREDVERVSAAVSPDADNAAADEAAAGTPAATAPIATDVGMRRVWNRFKHSRGAQVGFYLVIAFSLVAFLAPFLAHRLPLFWYDYESGKLTWPLVREFFAPSDTTEPMLERGINFLFLFIPIGYVGWRLMNKHAPWLGRKDSKCIALLFGALFAAALWSAIGGMIVDAGGKDWLHYELSPVPDLDDIADPNVVNRGTARAGSSALARISEVRFPDAATGEEKRRAILPAIQDAVEGPVLPNPGEGFETLGLDPKALTSTLDAARWNRMVVEFVNPGLLLPMRRFRGTFVAMAGVSLVALLGLTYICLAGAWQFTLTPRWLALLGIAVALMMLFRFPVRHDHTPYRELSRQGRGVGLFPLIPYGPNEQGFGPRQPPSWYIAAPTFGNETVVSWTAFSKALEEGAAAGAQRVRERLEMVTPGWRELVDTPEGRREVTAGLNALTADPELYDPDAFKGLRADANLSAYTRARIAGQTLSDDDVMRMNRLLLEKSLPGAIEGAAASRWKKPFHEPGTHVFGTDESGRDVLVRIIHGARVSLSVGFVSVFLSTVIGLVMGSLAAYYGGRVDLLISRFLEIMMCFPSFFLILAVIAVLDRRSIVNIMLVIGLTSWTGVARLVRGEMLRQKKMDYVMASVALGASDTRTIFRHILPNAMAPVLVTASFAITGAILTESSLSFIGFGVTPPTPTWGQLLSETRDSPLANWWLAIFPGIVLFISVLAYNLTGDGLRDALDPRQSS